MKIFEYIYIYGLPFLTPSVSCVFVSFAKDCTGCTCLICDSSEEFKVDVACAAFDGLPGKTIDPKFIANLGAQKVVSKGISTISRQGLVKD